MSEKPFIWLDGAPVGGKRTRWYPHEVLARIVASCGVDVEQHLPVDFWEFLDPDDAAEWLPELRKKLDGLTTFTNKIEALAEGKSTICAACGSRFYPSRSDALYCNGACRMRAHRRSRVTDVSRPTVGD